MPPESRPQLIEQALEYLMALGTAERALVITIGDGQALEVKGAGFETDTGLDELVLVLLQRAQKERPRLDTDGKGADTRSTLLSSVQDSTGKVLGALYVESPVSKGAFQRSHLDRLREYSQELGVRLQSASSEPLPQLGLPESSPEPASRTPLLLGGLLLLLAVLWPAIGLFMHLPSDRPPPLPSPSETVDRLVFSDPVTAVRFFLVLVEREQFDMAYKLLSDNTASEVSPIAFQNAMQAWRQQQNSSRPRRVSLSTRDKGLGRVKLEPPPHTEEAVWEWTLIEQSGQGWKLHSTGGNPALKGSVGPGSR